MSRLAVVRSKTCSKCEQTKPAEDFPKRKTSKDGLHGWCRLCYRAYYSAASRKWREENRERTRANRRRAYHANREKWLQWKRDWDTANRELVNERAREAQRRTYATPEGKARMLEHKHRRRARVGQVTPELRAYVQSLYSLPCSYCGADENITVDHVIPLSRGGKHEIENLVPACKSCNSSKHDKLLDEWQGRAA